MLEEIHWIELFWNNTTAIEIMFWWLHVAIVILMYNKQIQMFLSPELNDCFTNSNNYCFTNSLKKCKTGSKILAPPDTSNAVSLTVLSACKDGIAPPELRS